jgi:tRNA(Ile)-lysidine synthase
MIHVVGEIPKRVAIAVSGGVDSMAVLDFLRRSRDVKVLHYNHGTGRYADEATSLVRDYCREHGLFLAIGWNGKKMPGGVSAEAWWREQRYKFFGEVTDLPIITAHHLGDVVENWIFTSLNGNPFLIPHQRDQYLRPFLTTEKSNLESWCNRKKVPYVVDPSNVDTKYRRNYIRHVMMPHVENINPGIKKTIKKKLINSLKHSCKE